MFFTSKEEREKAVPYSGFNTFTPGVSWGKAGGILCKKKRGIGVEWDSVENM